MPGAIRKLYGEIFLRDKASKNVDKVNQSLNKTKKSAEGLQGAMRAVGGALFLRKTLDIVENMVDLSGTFEQTTVAFEVMLGSAEKAKNMLQEIEDFSLVTPFTPEALTQNAKLLLNFGTAAEKILPSLKMLGDIAAGDQKKLNSLTLAFAQSSSVGRLMGQDLLQMINAGFNPLQIISKKTGKTMMQLKKEMEKGLISFDMVQDAFKSATEEGGIFHNMMNRMSKTWNGLVSTFQGFKGLIFRKIGDVFTTAFKPILKMINNVMKSLVEFFATERGMAVLKIAVIALSSVFSVVLVGTIWAAVAAATALKIALIQIIATGLAIAAALTAIFLIVEDIVTFFQGGESLTGDLFKWIWEDLKKTQKQILWLWNYILRLTDMLLNVFGSLGTEIIEALIPIDFFESLIDNIIDTFKNLPGKIWDSIKGLASSVAEFFIGEDTAKKPAGRAAGGMVRTGTSYIVGEEGPELFTPGASGFITPSGKMGNKISIKNLVGSIQITVQNVTEGAEEIKDIILDALNDLSENILPAESGLAII